MTIVDGGAMMAVGEEMTVSDFPDVSPVVKVT